MSLAPTRRVGGKRFSFLSRYLSKCCDEYHVLAKLESEALADGTAFNGDVHRVRMWPEFPSNNPSALRKLFEKLWARWLCCVDPCIGWVLPAIRKGIDLCYRHRLNCIIVTGPDFSAFIAGTILSKLSRAHLILDYRDPWTNHRTGFPKPLGKWLCPAIERWSIKQSSAVVCSTEIMRADFVRSFGDIKPGIVECVHNGFEPLSWERPHRPQNGKTVMVYAGNFYGGRQLTSITPGLTQMLGSGEISGASFRFEIFGQLATEDREMIRQMGLDKIIRVNDVIPYEEILKKMSRADILFLPSGCDVMYAVPFKFFDYLSVKRPILTVAPRGSSMERLMSAVECGEFAVLGEVDSVVEALRTLLRRRKQYSFSGAEKYRWAVSASQYMDLIRRTLNVKENVRLGAHSPADN
jgi:glycosyltransferase involved in cell wall biosynthesis